MSRKDDIKTLITNHNDRLQILKEKEALEGISVDPKIPLEIKNIEAKIGDLETQLRALEDSGVNNEESPRALSEFSEDTEAERSVQIYLRGDFSSLSVERRASTIDALAGLLRIPPEAIKVHRVYEGSIVFDLGISSDAVQRLRSLLQSNSERLRRLKVEIVILETESVETEEWVIKEGKFTLISQQGNGSKKGSEIGSPEEYQTEPALAVGGDQITIGDTQADHSAIAIGRGARAEIHYYPQPPQNGRPFQAPPYPPHFIDRPEETQAYKAGLLTSEAPTPGVLKVSVIHGLAGIGKTTLAIALAHDEDVQKRFSDGILWATLGQEPDLLSLLGGWVQALGDFNFRSSAVEATTNHLRGLLRDKAVLLVVDDAWQSNHLESFLIGGPKCSLLVTTRKVEIAEAIGATDKALDVMSESEAVQLMAKWAGGINEEDMSIASWLARELGYLALALQLVGAQVKGLGSWPRSRRHGPRLAVG